MMMAIKFGPGALVYAAWLQAIADDWGSWLLWFDDEAGR